ncbi:MAG: chemotaxis protein CheW [Desulfomonilia bacterium]|nr:chemotaxis protein CheW [Desulfomonilia bacterium]
MSVSSESAPSLSTQYVTFQLGDETYGISILKLNEIIANQKCTGIPHVPDYIKGVINLRGTVVPVIDLRERFGMGAKNDDQGTVIIILDVAGRTMGLIVDAVSDVVTLNTDDIKTPPPFFNGTRTQFISALGIQENRFIILLDVNRLLSNEELEMVDGV